MKGDRQAGFVQFMVGTMTERNGYRESTKREVILWIWSLSGTV